VTGTAALLLVSALPLSGQEAIPSNLVAFETERSTMCVPVLARLAELNEELDPLARRVDRIGALYQAVALEDSLRVAPFDDANPEDRSVQSWFQDDGELAREYVESDDEALLERRRELRAQVEEELEGAFRRISDEADAILGEDEELPAAASNCDGAILVREVVVEACNGISSQVCREAREGETQGRYRFVESAEDLWDVEQLRPWSTPTGIGPRPDGSLGGAQTGTLVRKGNVQLAIMVEPIIRERDAVPPEEAAEFDSSLESMGFDFDDPRFVMSPALVVDLDIDRPLGGETHYLLHFGDLSDPANQVFWSARAPEEGPVQDAFPVGEGVLAGLMSGEELTLTAIRVEDEETMEGSPLYTLGLTSVGQAEAVTTLVAYMAQGHLSDDLRTLFPPEDGSELEDF
jgi:hypothetical protein